MKKTLTILCLALICSLGYAQEEVHIDILCYEDNNEKNIYDINEIVASIVDAKNAEEGCLKYHIITNRNQGKSKYIVELWESPSWTQNFVFNKKRTRQTTKKDGSKGTAKYKAHGIAVVTDYDVYIRLIEAKTTQVLDLGILDSGRRYEIEDKEVREMWDPKNLGELLAEKEIEHEEEIANLKTEMLDNNIKYLGEIIQKMTQTQLLGPAKISAAKEIKKDKLKSVEVAYCPEVDFTEFGMVYYGVLRQDQIAGENIYIKEGTVYFGDKEGSFFKVRKGEKELLPYVNDGTALYIGDENKIDLHNISEAKQKETIDLDFRVQLKPTHTFSKLNILHFMFMLQNKYLNYDNIRVIAYDPLTESLNNTMTQSIMSTANKAEEGDLTNSLSNTHIEVTISDLVKSPLEGNGKIAKLLSNDSPPPKNQRYAFMTLSLTKEEKSYKSEMLEITGRLVGKDFIIETNTIDSEEIDDQLIDNSLKVLDIHESDKDKLKSVYVSSTVPMEKGNKYKVYSTAKFGKKTKVTGKLKIKEVLNRFVGIAEVKDGDKDLMKLWKAKKTMYSTADGSGFFSSGGFSNKLKAYEAADRYMQDPALAKDKFGRKKR